MGHEKFFNSAPSDFSDEQKTQHLTRLLEELRSLAEHQQLHVRQEWNRSLPVPEYIVDRWSKAKALGFGDSSSIYDSAVVLGDVKVGRHTWIGPYCILDGSGGLEIGDYCSISAGVQIYTHDTVNWAISRGSCDPVYAPVRIGSGCYIGPNVVISKDVTIGDCCVIGANSFVNKSIPSGTKAWGIPARCKGSASTND